MNPRRELSEIVAVSSGPGIKAPDSAMTKEEAKMATPEVSIDDYLSFCGSLSIFQRPSQADSNIPAPFRKQLFPPS